MGAIVHKHHVPDSAGDEELRKVRQANGLPPLAVEAARPARVRTPAVRRRAVPEHRRRQEGRVRGQLRCPEPDGVPPLPTVTCKTSNS